MMTKSQIGLVIFATVVISLGLGLGLGLGLRNREDGDASSNASSTVQHSTLDLHKYKWIDLTHTFHPNTTQYWPAAEGTDEEGTFYFNQIFAGDTEEGFYYESAEFCTPEHGGTHIDSPIHFARDRYTTEQIRLENLHGPGIVIDVTEQARENSNYLLSMQDVTNYESKFGKIPQDAVVLLRTGWGKFYDDRDSYFGFKGEARDASNLNFPSYGLEAARFLVFERSANVLGVDTASIDHGPSQNFSVHQLVFEQNIPALENVANLDQLPESGSWIIAMPMKIYGGSGGPVRIAALLPSD